MTITVDQFLQDFKEFGDPVKYPISAVTYYLNLAGLVFNTQRWGNLLDTGVELFIAHNLVIEARAMAESANGGLPGTVTGPQSSKSVGGVSVSYDTQAAVEADAGHWNLTTYGLRLVKLMKLIGAGPIQVGIGYAPPLMSSADAWGGPNVTPGWFSS